MKKFISLALIAASLAVSAQALNVGLEAGYLTDAKEEYISARIGYQVRTQDTLSQELGLELGYTRQKDSGVKGEILPLTVNYRFESTAANKLGYYFGAGAGVAFVDLSGFGLSDNDTTFAAQAFTGLSYQVSDAVKLHLGLKYIWIDDVKLFGTSGEVGDDLAITAGLSIKF
jgi:opacity protein-like surface antigen